MKNKKTQRSSAIGQEAFNISLETTFFFFFTRW